MTGGELAALIGQYEAVPELAQAYGEMLAGCKEHPEQRLWYTAWRICHADGEELGFAGFKGFNGGRPEIGYGINEEWLGQGLATEAVAALCTWALSIPGVSAVEAEAEADNAASIRVLEKCIADFGFGSVPWINLEIVRQFV